MVNLTSDNIEHKRPLSSDVKGNFIINIAQCIQCENFYLYTGQILILHTKYIHNVGTKIKISP